MSHPSEATLHDFVDEELPLDERARISAHLAGCAECRAVVAGVRRLGERARAALEHAEVAPSAAAWSAISARIEARGAGATRDPAVIPLAARRAPRTLRAAAVLALLAVSGAALWVASRTRPAAEPGRAAAAADSLAVALAASPAGTIERAYAPDLAALESALEASRDRLAPETIATVEENLAVLDRAIAEIRAALEADPANRGGLDALDGTYRAKLDILRRAARSAPQV